MVPSGLVSVHVSATQSNGWARRLLGSLVLVRIPVRSKLGVVNSSAARPSGAGDDVASVNGDLV
jgi:hypothetical protein